MCMPIQQTTYFSGILNVYPNMLQIRDDEGHRSLDPLYGSSEPAPSCQADQSPA
jgi:hypothetical protein